MRENFFVAVQAIGVCLLTVFFASELLGITNSNFAGGYCQNVQGCNRVESILCPAIGRAGCNIYITNCVGTGGQGTCNITVTNVCDINSLCAKNISSCQCAGVMQGQSDDADNEEKADISNDGRPTNL
ncbi:MAG: hypothetical protein LBC74_07750 [Planctomycetaceae bacterium]|jgi:hypothetical protein|nr:hypothetical protein [Planctomycetaceae bacterium]